MLAGVKWVSARGVEVVPAQVDVVVGQHSFSRFLALSMSSARRRSSGTVTLRFDDGASLHQHGAARGFDQKCVVGRVVEVAGGDRRGQGGAPEHLRGLDRAQLGPVEGLHHGPAAPTRLTVSVTRRRRSPRRPAVTIRVPRRSRRPVRGSASDGPRRGPARVRCRSPQVRPRPSRAGRAAFNQRGARLGGADRIHLSGRHRDHDPVDPSRREARVERVLVHRPAAELDQRLRPAGTEPFTRPGGDDQRSGRARV